MMSNCTRFTTAGLVLVGNGAWTTIWKSVSSWVTPCREVRPHPDSFERSEAHSPAKYESSPPLRHLASAVPRAPIHHKDRGHTMWLPICAYTSPCVSHLHTLTKLQKMLPSNAIATGHEVKRLTPSSLGFVFLQDLWLPHQTRRQCLDTSIWPTRLSMKRRRVRVGRFFSLGVACLESKCWVICLDLRHHTIHLWTHRDSDWHDVPSPFIWINKGICIGFRVWPRCLPRLFISFLSPSCTCCPGSVKAKDKYWW